MSKKLQFLSYCVLAIFLFSFQPVKAVLTADFTADECVKEVYRQGFDSASELSTWTLTPSSASINTWKLGNPRINGVPRFNAIDSLSIYSLFIDYDSKPQNEKLTSPSFDIQENYACSFYLCFDGGVSFLGNFTIEAEETLSGQKTKIFDAFAWSQESGHERPKWLKFNIDLAEFAGKSVKFIFTYKGDGGDDVLVDNFRLIQKSSEATAKAEILGGQNVHFKDLSTGNPTEWLWEFQEGIPATSSLQNPVIRYNKAGIYTVKLTVKSGEETTSETKTGFVVVQGVAPVSAIVLPEEGYLSPYAGVFIPRNQEVTFKDASKNLSTSWNWILEGATPGTSQEQNPTVKYANNGVYDLKLTVTNKQGVDYIDYLDIVQVGDTVEIWNLEIGEGGLLESISIPFIGYYGGSNDLGMLAYAEHFKKPIVPGSISEVSVFFNSVATISPDSVIYAEVAKKSEGLPGEIIAISEGIKVKDLQYDPQDWLPTKFHFSSPVDVNEDFFVIIRGIPSNMDKITRDMDEIVIAGVHRTFGQKSTVYHYMEEWNDEGEPTGILKWYKEGEDESITLAIAPRFTYKDASSGLPETKTGSYEALCPSLVSSEINFFHPEDLQSVSIYSLNGVLIYHSDKATNINVSSWLEGIYIIKAVSENKVYTQKIKISR